jgi:hypothetical protein
MGANQAFVLSTCMMEICELVESYKGTSVLDMGDFMMVSHQPASIVRLAKRCPNLKIVVCHLCAPDRELHDEWVAELHMMTQDNVWFDISSVPKIMAPDVYPYPDAAAYLKEAKGIVGATRLMWGTDAPFAATQDSYEHLSDYLMKNGAFTDSELADVYYNNANEVYFIERGGQMTKVVSLYASRSPMYEDLNQRASAYAAHLGLEYLWAPHDSYSDEYAVEQLKDADAASLMWIHLTKRSSLSSGATVGCWYDMVWALMRLILRMQPKLVLRSHVLPVPMPRALPRWLFRLSWRPSANSSLISVSLMRVCGSTISALSSLAKR